MFSRLSVRSYSSASQGIKINATESGNGLSSLTVVVNNAGSKAGKAGVSHLLSKYNFLNTETKSALRFTRESELLGGVFSSNVTRDSIVLKTQFLAESLPYYVEALGNVLTNTSFRPYELPELVIPTAKAEYEAAHANNAFTGLESLHELTFRKGLGSPLLYDGTTNITVDDIAQFSEEVYNTSNVALYASGVIGSDLAQFVGETAFSALPSGSSKTTPVTSFVGKESRIRAAGQSVALIGIPVKPSNYALYETLSAAIGSSILPGFETPLSKISGATSQLYKYQDAGLFVVSVSGSNASTVAQGIKAAKNVIKNVSAKTLSDATKAAQLSVALQSSFDNSFDVKFDASSAKSVSLGEFNYVAIGDVDALPYANEL